MRSEVETSDAPPTCRSGTGGGRVLDGRYRVEGTIGSGAMGVVLAARHVKLDERVAVKVLRSEYAASEEFTERFLREGRAMIKIRSEHGVRVLDVGTLDDGTPFLVMEHLEGEDLDAILSAKKPFRACETVDLVLQAVEAIAEAHALGIIHRDLKPANLFLTRRRDGKPCIKVLDFGISKFEGSPANAGAATRITNPTAIMGSPAYMSPEQMRSTRDVDARSDIWSLGVVLYEMLSGTSPFAGATTGELCARVLDAAPAMLSEVRPDLDANLCRAVHRCLHKDPASRFGNVAELAHALAPFGSADAARSAETASRVLGLASTAVHTLPPVDHEVPPPPAARALVHVSAPSASAWGRDATLLSGFGALSAHEKRVPRRMLAGAGAALGVCLGIVAAVGATRPTTVAAASPSEASHGSLALASVAAVPSPAAANEVDARAFADAAVRHSGQEVAPPVTIPALPVATSPALSKSGDPRRAKTRTSTVSASHAPSRLHTVVYDPAQGLFDERK